MLACPHSTEAESLHSVQAVSTVQCVAQWLVLCWMCAYWWFTSLGFPFVVGRNTIHGIPLRVAVTMGQVCCSIEDEFGFNLEHNIQFTSTIQLSELGHPCDCCVTQHI